MLKFINLSIITIMTSAIIKLPLKRNQQKAITTIFQVDMINVELESNHKIFTTLFCQDVKSSYNFCEKFNNSYLPCDEYCQYCFQDTCLGEQNEETGEYAKFAYQEIIVDGIKVIDRIQVFQQQVSNQTNGYFSISINSYLINQLVKAQKIDPILSFKYCIDDLQLIIGQDISQSQEKLEMIYDQETDLIYTNILGVGINNIYFTQQQFPALIVMDFDAFSMQEDLADQVFQLLFRKKAGIRITPCIDNYTKLFNISIFFENNQTILLEPNEYYFKDSDNYCIPMTGNQYITVLGYPVFKNRTLIANYKDFYYKIDQTLCPEKIELTEIRENPNHQTNWFSFHFLLLYIFITLITVQLTRILILRYKRRLQIAQLVTNDYNQQI